MGEPAKKVDAAPKLDGGAVSKAPAAAAAIGGPGENHDGAEPEDLQDKGECGDQSHEQAEKGLKPPRLVSEKAFQKGDRPEVRWAVIFPFHGNKGSHRIESVNISWTSLERAMRNAIERETKAGKPKWGSTSSLWTTAMTRAGCQSPLILRTSTTVRGRKA